MQSFDLIVIGSGPAGQRAAIQAAKIGKARRAGRKARMRRRRLHQHRHHSQQDHARSRAAPLRLQLPEHLRRQLPRQGKDHHGGSGLPRPARDQDRNRRHPGAAFAQQHRNAARACASFVDPHTIRVDELARAGRLSKRRIIIIATGTKPAVSAKVPINGRTIINSDQILQMPEIPKTLIVVGGGVIGVEYTCMFATLGVRVILVEKRPRLLEFADAEMVEALSYHLRDNRVTMRLNEEVSSVEETAGRQRGGEPGEQEEDLRRRAALRRGPAGQRGRAEPGGRRHRSRRSRGRIPVDADYRTKQPHIFAVGDVIGFPSLASVSMEQGRIAAAHAFGMHGAVQSGHLSVRHLHHPRDFLHRQDRGAAHRRGRSLRGRRGVLSRDRARPDPRRHHRPAEADLPSRDHARSWASTSSARAPASCCTSARR